MVKSLPAQAGNTRGADSIPRSGRSPGGGNGNPLQYPCLGNPTDRGAWRAAVRGVACRVGRDLTAGHTHTPSDPRDGLCGVRLHAACREGLPQTSLSHSLELIASPACLWTVLLGTPPPLVRWSHLLTRAGVAGQTAQRCWLLIRDGPCSLTLPSSPSQERCSHDGTPWPWLSFTGISWPSLCTGVCSAFW